MRYSKHLTVILFLIFNSLVVLATDSTAVYVNNLISGNDSLKSASLHVLVNSGNTKLYPILAAIYDKKLYLYNDIPVTISDKKINEDGSEIFSLIQVYPELQVLNDKKGQIVYKPVSSLKPVEIGRSDRLIISPIAPYLNLVSADTEKRKIAYSQLQNIKDTAVVSKLKFALSNEKNEDLLRVGNESLYSIQLFTTKSKEEKASLINLLQNNWGPNAEGILEQFINQEKDPELIALANSAIEDLQVSHGRLRFAQNIFSGLSLGSILIMIALGLSIIYGLAGVINMAHGEFLMIGAYSTFCIQNIFGKDNDMFFWISLPLSFLIAGSIGFIIERLIIRHLYAKPLESLLATWGVSLVLVQIARSIFGDLTAVRTPAVLSGGWEIVPHLVLPYNRLFIIVLAVVMISCTYALLYRSRMGLRIRAVTQNRKMSSCLGIETNKVDALTFFLGSGLAGIAGCAMTLIGNVVPDMGQTYIVDSFLVVVTGGVGNIAGSIVSGFGIGFLFKGLESFFQAVYGKVLILMLIILFLQFKPKGLFPDKGRIADE